MRASEKVAPGRERGWLWTLDRQGGLLYYIYTDVHNPHSGFSHLANAEEIRAMNPTVPPTPTSSPTSVSGRDEKGRFVRDNRGGPGNPHVCQMAVLRSALLQTVTPENIKEIAPN
jgi:hypothetical protein